jgi:hypothetical protein
LKLAGPIFDKLICCLKAFLVSLNAFIVSQYIGLSIVCFYNSLIVLCESYEYEKVNKGMKSCFKYKVAKT